MQPTANISKHYEASLYVDETNSNSFTHYLRLLWA